MDTQNTCIALFPVDITLGLMKNSVKAVKRNEDSNSHSGISEDRSVLNITPCRVVVISDISKDGVASSAARIGSPTRLGLQHCVRRRRHDPSRLLLTKLGGVTSVVSVCAAELQICVGICMYV
jgi:hypothetical protein